MKLFVRGLFACAWLVAGMVFTGCHSPSQGQFFLDNPQPRNAAAPSAAGRRTTVPPNGADVARFHVGDTVIVSFSGAPEAVPDHVESIKEDGTITLSLIGAIYAVGKTAGELQNEIQSDYIPKYYVRLTVTVKSGDRVYYVGGEVKGGGRQLYVDGTTVTKAIQTAGGLTDFANHGTIWLTRASTGQRIKVNYDKALENPAKDPPVYPDDQINVEKRIF
jgi:protein involved in polysaccharide export with SLBB domain